MSGQESVDVEKLEFASLRGSWMQHLCIEILKKTLIPFVESIYPDSHCFMADNDPKHTSNAAKSFLSKRLLGGVLLQNHPTAVQLKTCVTS